MARKTELWVKNVSSSDVGLSDLGVKIPRGKTVDLLKYSPNLSAQQVQTSLEGGSLQNRVSSGVLSLVKGPVKERPATLDRVKQSSESVGVKKTKTSIVVQPGNPALEEDGEEEGFSFADYGINELGPVEQKREGAAVVVNAQQDDSEDEEESNVETTPVEKKSAMSNQSTVTMEAQQKSFGDPNGKLAEAKNTPGVTQPFVVYEPPKSEEEPEEPSVKQKIKPAIKGNVITPQDGPSAADRDIDLAQALNKKAEELGVTVEELPESVVIELEAEVIGDKIIKDEAKENFDSQVATKTKDGATVMKIKEVGKEGTSE